MELDELLSQLPMLWGIDRDHFVNVESDGSKNFVSRLPARECDGRGDDSGEMGCAGFGNAAAPVRWDIAEKTDAAWSVRSTGGSTLLKDSGWQKDGFTQSCVEQQEFRGTVGEGDSHMHVDSGVVSRSGDGGVKEHDVGQVGVGGHQDLVDTKTLPKHLRVLVPCAATKKTL